MAVLDLLQNGVGQAGRKVIPTQQQHRQAVGHRQGGRGDQVGRAGSSRGGAKHEPLAEVILGVGRGGKAHGLLVLTAIQRQCLAGSIQGLAQTGHVAVAKDAKSTPAQPCRRAVDLDPLILKVFDDRLGDRQGHCIGQENVRPLPVRC